MGKSIMVDYSDPDKRWCFRCGTPYNLEKHHIFGASNRKYSEVFGLWVYLCPECHRGNNKKIRGVHFDPDYSNSLKKLGQQRWEEIVGTHEEWMNIFRKNYLEEKHE